MLWMMCEVCLWMIFGDPNIIISLGNEISVLIFGLECIISRYPDSIVLLGLESSYKWRLSFKVGLYNYIRIWRIINDIENNQLDQIK